MMKKLMEEEKNNDKESLKSKTPCFNGFINVCNKKINQCDTKRKAKPGKYQPYIRQRKKNQKVF